ncbi:MAG TPA: sporulation peptidase YabG [Candidatus Onthocola stercoravium]|nr:sporulation peptidase YabG [Candidatus Onthocola stercoravium]
MQIKKGDYVTRNSYGNDTVFKVINISDNIYYLKGVEVRLYADAKYDDLRLETDVHEDEAIDEIDIKDELLTRGDYFYLPAKVLHIDGDEEYLSRCLKFYKRNGIFAIGKKINEKNVYEQIPILLKEYKPDIVIITGHDAYLRKKGDDINDLKNYKNSVYFVKAVKAARNYEKSHEKLVIIAGACQSNYEELIKAGANFASSPKRVNIHALDPAIIASTISLTERNKEIDLKKLLDKTKYKEDGMGGIICNGLMYVGYPR